MDFKIAPKRGAATFSSIVAVVSSSPTDLVNLLGQVATQGYSSILMLLKGCKDKLSSGIPVVALVVDH